MRVGILGGTFDPIHIGHLALARCAKQALQLDELVLLPAGNPWQKQRNIMPAVHRLAMLELATRSWQSVRIDRQEIDRKGASFTIDSLVQLRERYGPQTSLILILGSDQFRNFASWHRYTEILHFCHLAVTQRELVPLTDLPAEVEALLTKHGQQSIPSRPAGAICFFSMPPVAVSSTALRRALSNSEDVDSLLPAAVLEYIRNNQLYSQP
jgi:nicotinate-nucleotide adenylyltransferase